MLRYENEVGRQVGIAVVKLGCVHAVGTITHFDNLPADHATGYLTLFTQSTTDDGAYIPAQDILINGTENLVKLRDLCNALIESKPSKKKNEH